MRRMSLLAACGLLACGPNVNAGNAGRSVAVFVNVYDCAAACEIAREPSEALVHCKEITGYEKSFELDTRLRRTIGGQASLCQFE
jgi:hypothetical protein